MRLPEVMARTGMSRSWIYLSISKGDFPAPLKFGRASCWDYHAVQAFLRRKLDRAVAPLATED